MERKRILADSRVASTVGCTVLHQYQQHRTVVR